MRSRSRWPLGKNRTRCCIDYAALLKTLCLDAPDHLGSSPAPFLIALQDFRHRTQIGGRHVAHDLFDDARNVPKTESAAEKRFYGHLVRRIQSAGHGATLFQGRAAEREARKTAGIRLFKTQSPGA